MSYYQREYQYSSKQLHDIVDAKVKYVLNYIKQGWEAYLITFKFDHIPGEYDAIRQEMEDEILRVYKDIVNWVLKYSGTEKNKERRPIWTLCPDYPVAKGEGKKRSLKHATINNGLHEQGVALQPPWSNIQEPLTNHFLDHQHKYVRQNYAERRYHPLREIHCIPITHDPGYVMEYVLKSVIRRRVRPEDIFSLPQARSEFKNLPIDPRKLTGGGAF